MLISFLGIGNNSIGYFRLGVGISIIFVISTLITVFNVKERNIVENQEKITLKDVFEILFKNDQLLVIIGSVIIYQIATPAMHSSTELVDKLLIKSIDVNPITGSKQAKI